MGDAALPDGARPVRAGPSTRRRRGVRGRAAALSGALARGQRPGAARLGEVDGLPGLPGAALDRARPDEGRRPLRRRGDAGRVRGARDVDDLEVRAPAAALRRRQGRRSLQPEGDVGRRAAEDDAPLHLGAAADHRAAEGHPGARHGDQRADDGLDDGHLLDGDRPRRPGDRDRQADLARRLALPPRGDRRGRRDGDRARVPAARVGSGRAALRRPGVRQRRRDRRGRARRQGRLGDRGLGCLGRRARRGRTRRPGAAALRRGARVARRLGRGRPAHQRGAARAALRHPRPGRARGPDPRRQRAPAADAPDRRGRERADLAGGRHDPRRAGDPGAARRAHERGRRDRLVLRVGAGSRPPLLGPPGDSSEARGTARRRLRPRLGAQRAEGHDACAAPRSWPGSARSPARFARGGSTREPRSRRDDRRPGLARRVRHRAGGGPASRPARRARGLRQRERVALSAW